MADTDDSARQAAEEGEPLLVRPYILGGTAAPAPRASAETWPETAAQPPAPTSLPAGPGSSAPAEPTVPRRRRRLAIVVAAVALLLVAAAAFGLYSALRPRSGATPQAIVDVSLPPYATSPATPPTASSPPAREQAPAPPALRTSAATTGSSSPAASPSSAATTPPARPATSAPAGFAPAPRASSPAATLSPVPAAARTGTVTGAGGLCLDLNGAVPFDGNHIQVYECNRTAAQAWTLAPDGTLRVMGMCAQVVSDAGVHITGCDGRRAAQWRAGPDQSLVNLSTGGCLTDPENGSRQGSWSRVTACTGASGQRWRLP
ncbi:ricin-type beta-trefoil lectin domain protein [Couchioplanes caeruleus]|uniref:ricin-type beta-trefoil lectin domain protein n=1 Tax=Couchioplanes caeruleus TaxID=56438 RepID=UPI0020BD8C68|nr:ricin-type beta-trefoil lectin domain protein [Couchioplanes caeruleus]UQU68308.1 ricin-type beta-trefoil lectin domain protein [Couchioplanes caeruleus]